MGLLAIDIDGTLTHDAHSVSPLVIKALEDFVRQGWKLCFITGRNFAWSSRLLSTFHVPYYLAVLNGALILEMPGAKVVRRSYLDKKDLASLDQILREDQLDYLIYSGMEGQDIVYHRHQATGYQKERAAHIGETWVSLESFAHLPLAQFATLKWIGEKERMEAIAAQVIPAFQWTLPVIRDPVNSAYWIAQASHADANKGGALDFFAHHRPLIAAGDDMNDLPMLLIADVKVVMADAPPALKAVADIIAPSVYENGLIEGLKQAVMRCRP